MTLAAARIRGDRIAIACDTRISSSGTPLTIHGGVVKSCIINCSICVAFSNSPELAERDIRAFVRKFGNSSPFGPVVEFFEQSSRDTGNDYIVAFASSPRIVKIADGKRLASAASTLWIGDRAAY